MSKHKVGQRPIRVDSYSVLSRAVEEGIEFGFTRFEKHRDTPAWWREYLPDLREHLSREIMNAICECFSFGEDDK